MTRRNITRDNSRRLSGRVIVVNGDGEYGRWQSTRGLTAQVDRLGLKIQSCREPVRVGGQSLIKIIIIIIA